MDDESDEDGDRITAATVLQMVSVYMQITRQARAVAEDSFANREQLEDAAEMLAQEYIRCEVLRLMMYAFNLNQPRES